MASQYDAIDKRLGAFVEGYIIIYECYLKEYSDRLNNNVPKQGKIADIINEVLEIGKSATETTEGAGKAGCLIVTDVLRQLVTAAGVQHNRKELNKIVEKLQEFIDDPSKVREVLAKSAAETFRCFESQLVQVGVAKGSICWQRAIRKVVHDAVNRTINYYKRYPKEQFSIATVTKGVISGESKRYKNSSCILPKIRKGHTVRIGDASVGTGDMFTEVGLIDDSRNYYSCSPGAYMLSSFWERPEFGFRLLYEGELLDKTKYTKLDPIPANPYVYTLTTDVIETKVKEVLEKIEHGQKDEEYGTILKDVRREAKKDLKELLRVMKDECDDIRNSLDKIREELKVIRDRNRATLGIVKETLVVAVETEETVRELAGRGKPEGAVWFDVGKPCRLFTGRTQEIEDLHERLQFCSPSTALAYRITVICGPCGIGKTELARDYVLKKRQQYQDVVWINADSVKTLGDSFNRLALNKLKSKALNDSGTPKTITALVDEVYRFFTKRKALFILDSVKKGDYINPFLPRNSYPEGDPPCILYTSRENKWERGIKVFPLIGLKEVEAVKFVKVGLKIEGDSEDQDIKDLVKMLEYVPSEIHKAIMYVEDKRVTDEYPISKYLEMRRTGELSLLGRMDGVVTVAASEKLSLPRNALIL